MFKQIAISEPLLTYIRQYSLRESNVLKALREETALLPQHNMQVSPEQGQFLHLLVKLLGTKKALEIGVFTGYSSLCIAAALPPDGILIACDHSKRWTSIAQRYWEKADVDQRVILRLDKALTTLDDLLENNEAGTYDFIFIDADKQNYINYYEYALQLLRPGGLVVLDNTLWLGKVLDPAIFNSDTKALHEINEVIFKDDRVDISLLPFADGLTLAYKR